MSDPFHVAILNRANGQTVIEGFKTAYRAKQRHEQINADRTGAAGDADLHAEYLGDSRDRKYLKTLPRVREVFAETMREIELTKRNSQMNGKYHTHGPLWVAQASGKPYVDDWVAVGKGDTEIAYFSNPEDAQLFRAAVALADHREQPT